MRKRAASRFSKQRTASLPRGVLVRAPSTGTSVVVERVLPSRSGTGSSQLGGNCPRRKRRGAVQESTAAASREENARPSKAPSWR